MAANMMGHKVCHTSCLQHFHYMTYIGCAGQIGILINYYQQPRKLPSNGGPALRFKSSVEDRITKGGGRSNLILLGVVIIFCQYSLSYILSPMCIGNFTEFLLSFGVRCVPWQDDVHEEPPSLIIAEKSCRTMFVLTPMQEEAARHIVRKDNVLLLSPTGSGKTLAFLLPILDMLEPRLPQLPPMSEASPLAAVVVPSRELALQMEQVLKELSAARNTEVKGVAVYGGRPAMDEHRMLRGVMPHIVFATPGRLLDHIGKGNICIERVQVLVVDEYDKCLELGFRDEMDSISECFSRCPQVVLTSATRFSPDDSEKGAPKSASCPRLLARRVFTTVDYLAEAVGLKTRIATIVVPSPERDKLNSLGQLLTTLHGAQSIVFVAHRESAERIGNFLREKRFDAVVYHGGMDQERRERALARFRAGASNVLVSTDLAARGLDIPTVGVVIHYHLPADEAAYTHRTGRTARWDASGETCLIVGPDEQVPEFVTADETRDVSQTNIKPTHPEWTLVYIGRGKKEKLSRGDVAGFFCKKGGLNAQQIGKITLADHAAYVAVQRTAVKQLLQRVAGEKIKGMKTIFEEVRK